MVVKRCKPGIASLVTLLTAVAAVAGCGGANVVKGESPFVSVSSMTDRGGTLAATMSIRNINDVPMKIGTLALTVRSGGTTLLDHRGSPGLEVDPNTTEDVVIERPMDADATALMASLAAGDVASLPFFLDGHVTTAEDGTLPFRHQGYLFRVPGRPGHFRATSTVAPEER